MNWSRWANCWLLSAALFGSVACRRAELEVSGESAKRAIDAPLVERSAVFDGHTLRLRGARGETLGVQLRFTRPERAEVALELPSESATVHGFRVGYVTVQEASTRLYGPSAGPGTYPDPLFPAGTRFRADRHAFFDVYIRPDAAPGNYSGQLRIADRSFAAELRVEPVRIDLRKDPLVWVFYLPKEIARLHHMLDDDNAALLQVERVYHELFREHGTYLAANQRPDRFPPRRQFVRGVKYWPVSLDTRSEGAIVADVQRWLELFEDTEVTPFAIPIDEPRTSEQKQRAKWIADVMGRAGGKAPRLLRGVTDSTAPVYANSIDLYIAPGNIPRAERERRESGARFWTYNGKPPQAGSMIIDTAGTALRTWGWIAYRYDVELWYAWEGLYFEDRYNSGGPTNVFEDPLTFDERSKGGSDFGNGDGLLAYPGPIPSLRLKALRRGLQDRLLLQKLSACGQRSQAAAIAAKVMPRALGEAASTKSWSDDEQVFESARSDVLDALSQRCRDAA
ncbi:MAG TPA: glycoside hydrolase domain-containing protein [Polyangiaceae bacterium]|nr:glycoside hydrolase domain-containing protein [Polyangiaceae bacterium]